MKLKNVLSVISIVILGGLMTMSLSACGLNKDSREWIEKNRVSDIYKVYPTKNPEDLFKVFPDGFGIRQSYTGEDGVTYGLDVEGDPETKKISGDLVKDPIGENKKVSDVSVEGDHYVFSDPNASTYWPVDSFLFQHLTINQTYLDKLKSTDHSYNIQSGSFNIEYDLSDPAIANFLNLKDENIEKFEIIGSGKNYRSRTLSFEFTKGIEFFEAVKRYIK